MKNFIDFTNEKLTLDDISKMKLDGRWVSANTVQFEDLQEGNIIETINNERYICAPYKIANQLLHISLQNNPFIFIRIKDFLSYGFMNYNSYCDTFPKTRLGSKQFTIKRVYTRKKSYKTAEELEKDLKNINKF